MALPSSPNNRKEVYLSNIAGQGTALPSEPHTREEEYLDYIAKNGGGGGTGEGDMTKAVYDDDLAVASAGGIADYVAGAITGKVDKVTGKGLSTNDYDDSAKAIVDGVTAALDGKVSKSNTAGLLKNDGTVDTVPKASQASVNAILDGTNIDSFGDVETALMGKMKSYALDKNIAVEMDLGGNESLVTQTTSNITSGSTAIPTSGAVYNYAFPRSEQAVLGAKNLADFVQDKGVDTAGAVIDYAGRIATVNPIMIKSGVQYKYVSALTSNVPACIYAVWNGSTLVRRIAEVTSGTVLDTSGGDKLYVCAYSTGSENITIDGAKAMIVLSTDTDSTYASFTMTNKELTENIAFPSASTMTTGTLVKSGDTARTRDVVGGYKKIKNTVFVDIEATANMTMAFSKTFPELDNWGIMSNMPIPVHRTALTAYFVHENTIYAGFAEIRKTDYTIHMLAPTLTLVDGDKIYIRGTYEA